MKKIICFDIDGVICKSKNGDYKNSKPIKKNINFINSLDRNKVKNDFEITSYKGYKELKESRGLIRFRNPDSNYMPIFFSYNLVKEGTMVKKIDQSSFDYRLIEESFSVPQVGWKGKNFYWVDEDNYVWMSKQIIDPFGKKARSTTLKKYSD